MPPRTSRNARAHSSIPIRTRRGTRTPVASNRHLSPRLVPLPENHPEEDFAEPPRSHRTESTLSRDNNPEDIVDEGLGDEPLERQTDSDDENAGNNLATAISALARNVRTQGDGSRAKVREPDPFDGTDPTKLRTFLVQLQLSFSDRPRSFGQDDRKVNFAISYLKGLALAHFENALIEPDLLAAATGPNNYSEFVSELKLYFGSLNIIGEAKSRLQTLTMKPTQRIAKYLVDFTRLSTITGWDSRALRHQFYQGLPAQIKDEIARMGKPDTLSQLRLMAQSIDGRYWKREEETWRERNSQPLEKKPDKSSNQQSSSNNSKKDSKNNTQKNQSSNQGSSSSNSEKKNPNLSDKLGKDGKLTQAECTRRINNNICLFCGGVGHTAKECPKSSSSPMKAKACAAQTKSDSAPVTEDTKKAHAAF